MFERIVYDQLYSFLTNEENYYSALLEGTDTWAFNIDRGDANAVICLELKNSVWYRWSPHSLATLSTFRVQDVDLFKPYSNNRTQKYVENESLSKVGSVGFGVP